MENTGWDRVREHLRHGIAAAAEHTEKFIRIAKKKTDIFLVKRELGILNSKLGKTVYNKLNSNKKTALASDREVKDLVKKITAGNTKIASLQKKIREIKNDKPARTAAKGHEAGPEQAETKKKKAGKFWYD